MRTMVIAFFAALAFLGGAVGGEMLRKGDDKGSPEVAATQEPEDTAHDDAGGHAASAPAAGRHEAKTPAAGGADADWFRFPNQFFVPIMRGGSTTAVMVLSLTLEMTAGAAPRISEQEHRLRDALLNALMIEANTGGFDGNFTAEASLSRVRASLLRAARKAGGEEIAGVLIEDIARQDQ